MRVPVVSWPQSRVVSRQTFAFLSPSPVIWRPIGPPWRLCRKRRSRGLDLWLVACKSALPEEALRSLAGNVMVFGFFCG